MSSWSLALLKLARARGNTSHDDEQRRHPALFHHASLLEFLLDPHRSEEFHVDVPRFDKELCEITLQYLGESGPAVTDERYILYCFLILLQTRTSRHPSYRGEVITRLAWWDDLNDEMLYAVLNELCRKCSWTAQADKLVDIIDRNLWTVFAPAVARMRAQCYQKFENAGLPQELFVMYHTYLKGLYWSSRDLHPDSGADVSFDWHIKDCIQHRAGVDAWDFCALTEHQFLLQDYCEWTWHQFMDVLDKYLPASEKESLQIEKLQRDALSEWKALVPAVAVFSIKHLISMLEKGAVPDRMKEKGGDNWRAITACIILSRISRFIWQDCPISTDVVSALEEVYQKFFPSHVVSTIEDTTFPFDFPHPESESQKKLLRSFSSPCPLPRWFFPPPDFPAYKGRSIRRNLGHIHDYIRLSIIWNGADPRLVHGFGRSWVYNPDVEHANKLYDLLGIGACELAEITTDPRTGLPIDYTNWSMLTRWDKFQSDYEKAERAHGDEKMRPTTY